MTTSLKRGDGSVYLTVERNRPAGWIHARWYGRQTLSTVIDGGLTYVDMLREEPCSKLLNDHRDLIGTFTDANDWIEQVWTPLIMGAGLRSFAQVLSPDIFGQLSIENLQLRIGGLLHMHMFDSLESAQIWLQDQE
ncbi:hypothetical protein KBK19_11540 [Microvirga sp. STR05]|uniref:STAS/SEC14 domain-containing protein n=2 Tax=Hymenobacter TaxID=89966 RepID=A0A7G7W4X5_9BACT|nr:MULTISPECIES: hypothetical protein [Hymenobacter]MBD2715670.1 hypothetical protein [Hymenobacter duratus]MBR7950578.1 hypothetical protein [Microvirga sp. STR05]QNH61418.1 hypothetical protein H4317_14815 [Hymenobacter sediminicola]